MAIKDAISTVLNRNAFYRDGYRMLMRISIVLGLVIALLIGTIVTLLLSVSTHQVYFATTSDGRIINIVPLNEPYRTQAEVIAWAASAVQNTMRFDYIDYHDRLTQASANFTTTGYDNFLKALKDSGTLDSIEANQIVVSLELNSAPEIKNAYVKNGVYTWYLQVPITIRYSSSKVQPAPISANLFLQVVRVSTLQNPDGISIEQWVVTKLGPNGK